MSKKILIPAISLVLLLAVGLGIFFGIRWYEDSKIKFEINDTLPDGGGKKATVILLGGQSNASGCSRDDYLKMTSTPEKYAEYEAGYDNVYINYYVSDNNESKGFVKCKNRQGEADFYSDGSGGHFGPELGMAEKLHRERPDELFFIIKCAWGGTNLFEQWLSPSGGEAGKLYKKFVKFVKTSINYLESKNYDVEIEGMCWMQGESDSFSTDHAIGYEQNLTAFIKDIRKEFKRYAAEDGIAFVDAYIAKNPVFWVYCDLVNESKRKVANASAMNVIVDTSSLVTTEEPQPTPDVPHYDSQSELKLGYLFIEALTPFLK